MTSKLAKRIFWILCVGIVVLLEYHGAKNLYNSDFSSELVLAKQLNEEGKILTENFYYSTEIRMISMQLIYAPLANMFSEWWVWRFVVSLIGISLLLLSYKLLCYSVNVKDGYYISSAIMILPLSNYYYMDIIFGMVYTAYIIIAFTIVALFILTTYGNNRPYLLLSVMLVLSFLIGLGGIREVALLFLPIFGASCYILWKNREITREEVTRCIIAFSMLVSSGIGSVINSKFLSKIYTFYSWDISWQDFNSDTFFNVLNGWLFLFGYKEGKVDFSNLISNFFSIMWIVFILFLILRILKKSETKEHKFIVLFFVTGLLVLLGVFSFTTMPYTAPRYNEHIWMFAFLIVAVSGEYINIKEIYLKRVIILGMIISSIIMMRDILKTDNTYEYRNMAKLLIDNNYYYGFSEFWTANVMVEASNGRLEMRNFGAYPGDMSTMTDITYVESWFQSKKYIGEEPEGKVFIAFRTENYNTFYAKDRIPDEKIIYLSPTYRIVGFDNYQEMMEFIQ